MIKKEIEGKELRQVLHFRFSFEPRFSEVDMYTIVDRYDNERETWSKSSPQAAQNFEKNTQKIIKSCLKNALFSLKVAS
jgi:hypothetical protein